jgi:hypothetical protein
MSGMGGRRFWRGFGEALRKGRRPLADEFVWNVAGTCDWQAESPAPPRQSKQ